jgi:hypothetical protein
MHSYTVTSDYIRKQQHHSMDIDLVGYVIQIPGATLVKYKVYQCGYVYIFICNMEE